MRRRKLIPYNSLEKCEVYVAYMRACMIENYRFFENRLGARGAPLLGQAGGLLLLDVGRTLNDRKLRDVCCESITQ